jgi:type IV pilus assembly protein PilW
MVDLRTRNEGFTLVELLVSMAIGLIVLSAVYSTYTTQQKSYVLQEQVASMQQNLRAAMYFIVREIRMAGCDPTGDALAGITGAGPTSISFTRDIRSSDDLTDHTADGDTNDTGESITYQFVDSDGDGVNDRITRNNQALAENIDALDFVYLNASGTVLDDDGNGNVTTNIPSIVSVQVTVVARTGRGDRGYTNQQTFSNRQGRPLLAAQNDNFHRKDLTSLIRCRNL